MTKRNPERKRRMDAREAAVIEVGEEATDRAKRTFSKQERFKDNGTGYADDFYSSSYFWIKIGMKDLKEEPYKVDNRTRDEWLMKFWTKEPHWSGAVGTTVLVDSSRPWRFIGGKTKARRYANILHYANDGQGWRKYFRQQSLAYRVADFGSTTELGRQGVFGPLRAIYHVDPSKCKWTKSVTRPLQYYPPSGRIQKWRTTDFFNVCSMPNIDEKFRGLGYCATSRAFDLIKLLYGVLIHDQEMVGARMMKGLLLLQGIEEEQWVQAMEAHEAQQSSAEREFFGGVYVLASLGAGDVDGKLIALSQLPEGFDRQMFIDQTIYAYSLILGYDPREFWPISSGVMGTAQETEAQARKAATKGTLEFPHAWQEQLQAELPMDLHFEFEQRDTDAELIEAQMAMVWGEVVDMLAKGRDSEGSADSSSIIEGERALEFLVEKGIFPPEWTAQTEPTVISDQNYRTRMLENRDVREAIVSAENANEPIIEVRWTSRGLQERLLWESGSDALKQRVF